MKHYTIPIFVPELACPNRCVFCNQNSISGCHDQPTIEDVERIIVERLTTIRSQNTHIEIGFFGGNFTGIDESLQNEYLTVAKEYLDQGVIKGIRISTRPDYITTHSLGILKKFKVTAIELGAQSLHDDVLLKVGRGHSVEDIRQASQLIKKEGFELGLQMMTGLPGDTPQKSILTAKKIIEFGAACTRIYPTLVIRDTDLEQEWLSGNYKPQSLNEAVSLTADLIELFEANGVKVLRVGLHPSEDLTEGKNLLAGPYHVSFKQLAETELWRRKILKAISQHGSEVYSNESFIKIDDKKITICYPINERNAAIGYNSSNRKMLEQQFAEVHFISKNISKVNLPLIIADKRIPLPAKNALNLISQLRFLEGSSRVYKSISGHPDIFMCYYDSTIIVAPSFPQDIIEELIRRGYKVRRGTLDPGMKYPESARYNSVVTDHLLIHNFKITDDTIKETFKDRKLINVNQGYTRCNLLPLNENQFITSDKGIEKALISEGLKVCYIDPQTIILKGQKHGFFPGCCGILENKLLINGSLSYHPQKIEINNFIASAGLHIIELFDGKLTDIGSLFIFPGISK